jgi:TPP-dependent indolepyruvate ferredoxin oxidoreductase alpha subunit
MDKITTKPNITEINPETSHCVPKTFHLLLRHPISRQAVIDVLRDNFEMSQFVDTHTDEELLYIKEKK